ncbi:MAG: hypothetical protein JSV00_03765 [bacterium]|nr:MAG: hypothetical protein JSV00_03765 [bacterium]
MKRYILLALLWTAWCTLHSALISGRVMARMKECHRDRMRYFRIIYNTVSLLTIVPVILYSATLRTSPFFTWSGAWRLPQVLLVISALALFVSGALHYDLLQFLGVRQLREGSSGKGLTQTGGLDVSGILGVVRHPWYTGGMLILWARPLDPSALVTNLVLTAYLVVGAHLEERKLVEEFGQEYRQYQRQVPMFFPGWGRKGRGRG